jgi:hypothetical protein
MIRTSQLLKKYGMRVGILMSALLLPLLAVMPVANAAAASGVSPDITCASGFSKVRDAVSDPYMYINAQGVGVNVEMNSTATSCWHGYGTDAIAGEFKDEGGNCLAWDSASGTVVMQTCNGQSYQEWFYGSWSGNGGVAYYQNEWALDNNKNSFLAADGDYEDSLLSLTNQENSESAWYA